MIAFRQAVALHQAGRLDAAEAAYRQVLRGDAGFVPALSNLGLLLLATGRAAEAAAWFAAVRAQRPDDAEALLNHGAALQALDHLDAAGACYEASLARRPDHATTRNNLGSVRQRQGNHAAAEHAYRAALRMAPGDADVTLNLATLLLLTGRLSDGWPLYEARWRVRQTAPQRDFAVPRWTGAEPLAGRTILLHAEQGLGDTLQFCRYAPLLAARGARVLLEVPPPLVRLLRTLDGVQVLDGVQSPYGVQIMAAGAPLPPFDLHSPLLSLPLAFGTDLATIPAAVPYLRADPAAVAAWQRRLATLPGRRVGLAWAGGPGTNPHAAAIDRRRSLPLAALAPLAAVSGWRFVSLQTGPGAAQTAPWLHDPTAGLDDFADTAALVAQLDLVIAVDTAVAHLAGALGKPVWLLNRFDPCWRWLLDRDDSPWYPTLRQFRQPAEGDWTATIARVAAALAAT